MRNTDQPIVSPTKEPEENEALEPDQRGELSSSADILSPHAPITASIDVSRQTRHSVGILFKIGSTFSFAWMGACVKLLGAPHHGLSPHFPVGQVVFCRSFFALIPVFIWLAIIGKLPSAFSTTNRMGHIRRGLIGAMGMFFGFAALSLLPLPDATAISFATPLFCTVLAALLLGELVRIYRWSAVLIGFCGVIVMLWPHLSAEALSTIQGNTRAYGAFFGLCGAMAAASAMIEVRRLTATENTAAIVTYFSLMTTVLGMISILGGAFKPEWAWAMPSLYQALFLILAGICGGFGQIFLTESYRHAPASLVAPFDYTAMIFALTLGYLFFGDIPDPLVFVGVAIVSGAGIYVIWREHRLGLDRSRPNAAS